MIATGKATITDMAAKRFQGMLLAYCPTMLYRVIDNV